MSEKQIKPGRPLGPVADAVLERLAMQPSTARELALHLQAAIPLVEKTCSRLLSKGRIRIFKKFNVTGCNKPVSQYAIVKSVDSSKLKTIIWGR